MFISKKQPISKKKWNNNLLILDFRKHIHESLTNPAPVDGLSHYSQGFNHPRWCRISFIHDTQTMTSQAHTQPPGVHLLHAAACSAEAPRLSRKPWENHVRYSEIPPGWWFGTWLLFSIIYVMSSFPLTNSYFSDGQVYHQPATMIAVNPMWIPCFPLNILGSWCWLMISCKISFWMGQKQQPAEIVAVYRCLMLKCGIGIFSGGQHFLDQPLSNRCIISK